MGHDIIRCDFCNEDIMEGRNDCECSCGAICNHSTKFKWEKPNKNNIKQQSYIINNNIELKLI